MITDPDDFQGKRPEQIKLSEAAAAFCLIALSFGVVVLLLFNVYRYWRQHG